MTLVQGDLRGIVRARRLSRATMRNIRQNLFFAFVYNALGVPIAAGVLYPFFGILLSPMFAAAAMALSSVSVIANALRLRRVRICRAAPSSDRVAWGDRPRTGPRAARLTATLRCASSCGHVVCDGREAMRSKTRSGWPIACEAGRLPLTPLLHDPDARLETEPGERIA